MAEEQSQLCGQPSSVPPEYSWPTLLAKDGDELETHYRYTLEELSKLGGMPGLIFRKAQNKIQDPAKMRRLIVNLIGREQWSSISSDVKGDAYEGVLEKNAADVKGGAGQYFTPRALIATPPAAPAVFCWPRTITPRIRRITPSTASRRSGSRTARCLASNWWTASHASAP